MSRQTPGNRDRAPEASERLAPSAGGEDLRCDICGQVAPRVRRVALDRDYDRLRVPHRELFACPECSRKKERSRLGL